MNRPWQTWLGFAFCLTVALAAMAWISLMALELDHAEAKAQADAALEENVRLALWRMETCLTGFIAQESSLAYFAYTPFHPVERAYTRMFNELERGEVLVPSPLLAKVQDYVLLHFQIGPDGEVTSPQVPEGNMRRQAEQGYTSASRIEGAAKRLAELRTALDRETLLSALPTGPPSPLARVGINDLVQDPAARQTAEAQSEMSNQEFKMRNRSQAANFRNLWALNQRDNSPTALDVQVGLFTPLWMADRLLQVRRVEVTGALYLQGCWIDWPGLKGWLLGEIRDLLPGADLIPAARDLPENGTRCLAALPVTLLPGGMTSPHNRGFSLIHISLITAWACVLLAGAAVAALLYGALMLSERRGAFVSAVTHELRTPLTTLRMYTEMLSEEMVPDGKKRKRYLETMKAEADRLGHLVENVLAYSRLEIRGGERTEEILPIDVLLDGVRDRLAQHAARSGMTLVTPSLPESVRNRKVKANPGAVEQILFNLVDNACKYAVSAEDKRIHLEAGPGKGKVLVRVFDHGPGIHEDDRSRLFKPFRKSAREAARSAPGVGLGLSLSRRLAREMGGDLTLDRCGKGSACMALALPLV